MKYSKKKFDSLMQSFNEITSEEQKSYTDKIFVKIVDSFQKYFYKNRGTKYCTILFFWNYTKRNESN